MMHWRNSKRSKFCNFDKLSQFLFSLCCLSVLSDFASAQHTPSSVTLVPSKWALTVTDSAVTLTCLPSSLESAKDEIEKVPIHAATQVIFNVNGVNIYDSALPSKNDPNVLRFTKNGDFNQTIPNVIGYENVTSGLLAYCRLNQTTSPMVHIYYVANLTYSQQQPLPKALLQQQQPQQTQPKQQQSPQKDKLQSNKNNISNEAFDALCTVRIVPRMYNYSVAFMKDGTVMAEWIIDSAARSRWLGPLNGWSFRDEANITQGEIADWTYSAHITPIEAPQNRNKNGWNRAQQRSSRYLCAVTLPAGAHRTVTLQSNYVQNGGNGRVVNRPSSSLLLPLMMLILLLLLLVITLTTSTVSFS